LGAPCNPHRLDGATGEGATDGHRAIPGVWAGFASCRLVSGATSLAADGEQLVVVGLHGFHCGWVGVHFSGGWAARGSTRRYCNHTEHGIGLCRYWRVAVSDRKPGAAPGAGMWDNLAGDDAGSIGSHPGEEPVTTCGGGIGCYSAVR
jgi:hypothetical protein